MLPSCPASPRLSRSPARADSDGRVRRTTLTEIPCHENLPARNQTAPRRRDRGWQPLAEHVGAESDGLHLLASGSGGVHGSRGTGIVGGAATMALARNTTPTS